MLIVTASLAIFVYGLIAALLGTILPDLSERFQLTPKQNGTIAFAQALGLMLASLAAGPLIDSQGKKIALVLGLALICAVLMLLPRSKGYSHVVALLFVLGVGGGILVTGANTLVSDVSETHRATALTFVNLFFGLGGLITPFLAANLFKSQWVKLGYTIALLTFATLVLCALTSIPGPSGASGFALAGTGAVFSRPALYLLGLFLFLYVSCEVGVWNWLVQHLIAQGIAESRALNILSLGFALGMLIGRTGMTPVLMRVASINATLVAAMCMAVATWLLLKTRDASRAWILVFIAGIAMAPVFPATVAIVGDVFTKMSGTAIGFVITCGWAGLAVSSRIIGAIAGGDSRRLNKALLVIPVFSLVMVALNILIRFAV